MIVVVMGVAGSGKTTVGTLLAEAVGCAFLEGDLLHPAENIEAMTDGIALTDADRAPWLAAIRAHLLDAWAGGRSVVVACSALKESYRAVLSHGLPITWVYLRGPSELIRSRLERRTGHFFDVELLSSQIETLEEPRDAISVDISMSPADIVDRIMTMIAEARDVLVCPPEELGAIAAAAAAARITDAINARGRCSLVLSGGATPRSLHRTLASRFADVIPWQHVHVFWSDERYVSPDDARSNYRMGRETLLDHVPCPPANIHPMPTHFADPAEAARKYEATLRAYFAGGRAGFDLAILGVGDDGHTASLFPGAPAVDERTRWVREVFNEAAEPPTRLTLTVPLLARSERTWFLVAGSSKASAVRNVLTAPPEATISPATVVNRAARGVTWWLDRAAAAQLAGAGVMTQYLAPPHGSAGNATESEDA